MAWLVTGLERERQVKPWVDLEGIYPGERFWSVIKEGIDAADTFIFVISPDSVSSKWCMKEIAHAEANHKRFLPILYKRPSEGAKIPDAIRDRHHIDFQDSRQFDHSLRFVIESLDTDPAMVRFHTWLLVRARKWERGEGLLLRSRELKDALFWNEDRSKLVPAPTPLQVRYLEASKKAKYKRRIVGGSLAFATIMAFLALSVILFETDQESRDRLTWSHFAEGQSAIQQKRIPEAVHHYSRAFMAARDGDVRREGARRLIGSWVRHFGRVLPTKQPILAAFSKDGGRVAILGGVFHGEARLWDTNSGQSLGNIPVFGTPSVAQFSPNGRLLLIGTAAGWSVLWNPATGDSWEMEHDSAVAVWRAAFHPHEDLVLTSDLARNVRIWNSETRTVRLLDSFDQMPMAMVFSPDGSMVGIGFRDHARLWDTKNWIPRGKSLVHTGRLDTTENQINLLIFSPDGRRVLTGAEDTTARLWRVTDGTPVGPPMLHAGAVVAGAFSMDGRLTITGSSGKQAHLWDAETGEAIGEPFTHTGSVRHVSFGRLDKTLVTGSNEGAVSHWDVATGTLQGELTRWTDHEVLAFSADGLRLVFKDEKHVTALWDAAAALPVRTFTGHTSYLNAVAFTPDGQRILTGSEDGTVRSWDIASGTSRSEPLLSVPNGFGVESMAVSPNGKILVTGDEEGYVRAWDLHSGAALKILGRHEGHVDSLCFHPDGTRVLSGSWDTTARLWNLDHTKGSEPRVFEHRSDVYAVAISIDGKTAVTSSSIAKLWDLGTGAQTGRDMVHSAIIEAVSFSPDGRLVVTGGADSQVQLWDAATGRPVGDAIAHNERVYSLAFSPDGQTLVTGSEDRAFVWDLATRQLRGETIHHPGRVVVAFGPGGQTVLTGGSQDARLWNLAIPAPGDPEHLREWVLARIGEDVSAD